MTTGTEAVRCARKWQIGSSSATLAVMRAAILFGVVALAAACTASPWSLAEDCESPARDKRSVSNEETLVEARAATAASDRPVIVTMRTREYDLVVHGGDDGFHFTVALAGGTVLASLLDAGDLQARFPELHQHFETAFAGEASMDRVSASVVDGPVSSGWAGM